VNGPTSRIEKKILPERYLKAVPVIKNYLAISCDEASKIYRTTKGAYKSSTYAIDNRIRLACFTDVLRKSRFVELKESAAEDELLHPSGSKVNIVGGGERFATHFADIKDLPTLHFEKKRDLFFFNLKCDKSVYERFSTELRTYFIANTAEILVYPFLHPNCDNTINITVNIIKGSPWDQFENDNDSEQAFTKFKELLSNDLGELASDIDHSTLADDQFKILNTSYYYKQPVKSMGNKLYLGIGETITKNDPLLGHGYNSGVDVGVNLVKEIINYCNHNKTELLKEAHLKYASQMINYLYHINRTSTQGSGNQALSQVYDLAVRNKPLKDYLFSTFDDLSLYFPWLIDEEETKRFINKYQELK
jgi:hypothetical protein